MKHTKRWGWIALGAAVPVLGAFVVNPAEAAPPPSHQEVTVTNTAANPVPTAAQGVTAVNGTVAATQSGAWTVGLSGTPTVNVGTLPAVTGSVSIDGTPAVTSADATNVAYFASVSPQPGVFTDGTPELDTSAYRTVKIEMTCFEGSCANVEVRVYSIVGSHSFNIDGFNMAGGLPAISKVYEVPGPLFTVQLINHNASDTPEVTIAVFGRSN